MKAHLRRRQLIFRLIGSLVVLLVISSAILGCRNIFKITHNYYVFYFWVCMSVWTQLPVSVIPIDWGKTVGFVNRRLPQWGILLVVTWNIFQIFMLVVAPLTLALMPYSPWFEGLPWLLLTLVLATVFRSVHSVVERKINIDVEGLGENWKPLTILHLSDIHSGPYMKKHNLEKIVSRLNDRGGFDMCVLTGDIVNHSSKEIGWTLETLEKLQSPLGSHACIGNHEYIDDENVVINAYRKSKINFLLNETLVLDHENSSIRLIGVDYPFESDETSVSELKALVDSSEQSTPARAGELKLLLSHHPNGFNAAKKNGIPVTLSGHTHGGQIFVAGMSIVAKFQTYIKGHYQDGVHSLYVNSGLGNWMPFRINVPCEYALITISRRG